MPPTRLVMTAFKNNRRVKWCPIRLHTELPSKGCAGSAKVMKPATPNRVTPLVYKTANCDAALICVQFLVDLANHFVKLVGTFPHFISKQPEVAISLFHLKEVHQTQNSGQRTSHLMCIEVRIFHQLIVSLFNFVGSFFY